MPGWLISYLVIGALVAGCCEYDDGTKGLQSPGRFLLMSLGWPLLALYMARSLLNGTAKFKWKGRSWR